MPILERHAPLKIQTKFYQPRSNKRHFRAKHIDPSLVPVKIWLVSPYSVSANHILWCPPRQTQASDPPASLADKDAANFPPSFAALSAVITGQAAPLMQAGLVMDGSSCVLGPTKEYTTDIFKLVGHLKHFSCQCFGEKNHSEFQITNNRASKQAQKARKLNKVKQSLRKSNKI